MVCSGCRGSPARFSGLLRFSLRLRILGLGIVRRGGEELPVVHANEQARVRLALVLPLVEQQVAIDVDRGLGGDVPGECLTALAQSGET